jgi:hypothetical protein
MSMIFRSRKSGGATAVAEAATGTKRKGDRARATGDLIEEIDDLVGENRRHRDPEVERRIIWLRHLVGLQLTASTRAKPDYPSPAFDRLPPGSPLPEFRPEELTPETLRAAIMRDGCMLVRGLVDPEEAAAMVENIDRAVASAIAHHDGGNGMHDGLYEQFHPEPPFEITPEDRAWIRNSGGIWAADSPRLMFDMLELFDRVGLRRLIAGYLGERPALSLNKCTLRKVSPDAGTSWHQDGAFLGDVRALNVWLALSRCGEDAPGLDLVPRRLDEIVPTGTDGALFGWSVSPAVAQEAARGLEILRPTFEPGDALLFDDLFLHRTAADREMPNPRYAIESWFFGPSAFPGEYAPLAF